MKNLYHIIAIAVISILGIIQLNAQTENDSIKVSYRNKTVAIKPKAGMGTTNIKFNDTAENTQILVKVAVVENESVTIEEEIEKQLDSGSKKIYKMLNTKKDPADRKFIKTSFFNTFDIGFVNTINEVDNKYAFDPKMTKSANISIGIVNQNMNLYKGRVLFSYGLNLNNYYLKYSDKQMIQTLDNQGFLTQYRDSANTYSKNRLDVRYLTVPVLLEYHSKKGNFNIAAGVEYGFNGRTHYKQKGETNTKDFHRKTDNDIKINPTQLNAVLRIGIDNLAVYAKYSLTDMYESSAYAAGNNPHQHMMSFGICLFGI